MTSYLPMRSGIFANRFDEGVPTIIEARRERPAGIKLESRPGEPEKERAGEAGPLLPTYFELHTSAFELDQSISMMPQLLRSSGEASAPAPAKARAGTGSGCGRRATAWRCTSRATSSGRRGKGRQ